MTWSAVAHKDFQDAVRSRTLALLTLLFAGFVGLAAFAFAELVAGEDGSSMADLLWALLGPASLLIPIIAILVSYRAIAGERELGSMRFLLALPHTRRDVLLGKVVGRTVVVSIAVFVGFLVGAVVAVLYYEFSPVLFLSFTLLTVLLGLVYVCIGVSISATTGSVSRAAGLVLGVYILLAYLWAYLWLLVVYVVNGFSLPDLDSFPTWFDFMASLSPSTAYQELMVSAFNRQGGDIIVAGQFDESLSLPDWFPLLTLIGWVALALAIGYWRFDGADLS